MDLPLSVLSQVAAILEQHGIRYVLVGSFASSIHGMYRWFRAGNETSINQWNDVVGILGTSHPNLDFNYLRTWANELGLISLLQKALEDAQDDSTI
jgi:hypothetical protein